MMIAGLGAAPYSCSTTLCTTSSATQKQIFEGLQAALNTLRALSEQSPLTVDGKLGKNTLDAVKAAATATSSYASMTLMFPLLLGYGTKAPTIKDVAANAAALTSEVKKLTTLRKKEIDQAAAKAENATAADLEAETIALVHGKDSPEAKAAEQRAVEAKAAAADAAKRLLTSGPWGLPRITGNQSADKVIYGLSAVSILGVALYQIRLRQGQRPRSAPAAAPAPAATQTAMAGAWRRGRR